VRCLVRSHTIKDCEQRVKVKEREGWKRLTEVKLDDSHISWGDISYVCVMEMPDNEEAAKNYKKRRFNKSPIGF
jgi:hypothetical protein